MKYYDTERQLNFLEVCSKGDKLEAEQQLRSGEIDVNFQHGINQWTALHWAAKRGHEKVCIALLDAGFSPYSADAQNRTPYDVCSAENISLRNLLCPSNTSSTSEDMHDTEGPREVNGNKFTPAYIKHPQFPYSKQASFDSGSNPSSPTTRGYYSYGRRDSATRTRFLLVRTSCGAGKEAFKRITLPGGSTVEELRKTVENAMKQGPVQSLMTLPDNVLIEEESQIEAFDNCQKISVIFGEPIPTSPPQTPTAKQPVGTRRRSLQTVKRDDTPDNSESSSPAIQSENFTPKFPKAVPEESAKMNTDVVTPPPSPTIEIPPVESEEDEDEEESEPGEPVVPSEVSVTTDLYFRKEQVSSEIEQQNAVPVVNQEHQDIMESSKKWTTLEQVTVVAAAVSLVGLGCYLYKIRK